MKAARQPSLFVSHGSPMLALEPGATGAFFSRFGRTVERVFGRPWAVVAVSPHTAAHVPVWVAGTPHHAIHDFGGFPPALFALQYHPPGAPELARQAQQHLRAAGVETALVDQAGLDHGIWSVLRHAWPDAAVPVLPLALTPAATPHELWRLGEALAWLGDEGVLVLGTGGITHNLRRLARSPDFQDDPGRPEDPVCAGFRDWVARHAAARDWPSLFDYRRLAPGAVDMHPTDEHWLPFYVAAGVGGAQATPQRVHEGYTYGCLGMDAYAFGDQAATLAVALDETSTSLPH